MENGAVAFLEKPFSRATLQSALDIAFLKLEDQRAYEAYLARARRAVDDLGESDGQVLRSLARGRTNDAIAEDLGLPPTAVDVARARIFAQLGIESVTEALRLAFAAGLGARP